MYCLYISTLVVAPYAGAWIEIKKLLFILLTSTVAPYAGAWIEMIDDKVPYGHGEVAPYAGAWIEIFCAAPAFCPRRSHPTRVRGLKCQAEKIIELEDKRRTLRGCVD